MSTVKRVSQRQLLLYLFGDGIEDFLKQPGTRQVEILWATVRVMLNNGTLATVSSRRARSFGGVDVRYIRYRGFTFRVVEATPLRAASFQLVRN